MANNSKEALIIEKVISRISDNVADFQNGTVDLDMGQLDFEDTPSLAYPACLIDIVQVQYSQQQQGTGQFGTFQMRLKFAFDVNSDTEGRAPQEVREIGYSYFDIINNVYKQLQYWNIDGICTVQDLRRLRMTIEKRDDNLKVVNVDYQATFQDASATAENS
jgi:hypothetical protein